MTAIEIKLTDDQMQNLERNAHQLGVTRDVLIEEIVVRCLDGKPTKFEWLLAEAIP